jgi:HSP90 family molecular chaperone
MSETPTPKTPEQKEAFSAVCEALGDALFLFLTDETFTEDELEVFAIDIAELAYLCLGVFDPQIITTEIAEDGKKKFTFSMTIPTTDPFDTFRNYYKEVIGVFPEDLGDDDDENDE